MQKEHPKSDLKWQTGAWLLIEVAVYAVFVFFYFFLVLHFLCGSLKEIFDAHKTLYALAALGLMTGQAVLLEFITSGLFRIIRGKTK